MQDAATTLTPAELAALAAARARHVPQNRGNIGRANFKKSLECCVCNRKKHDVKWETRWGTRGTSACGSWCYACKHAALKLSCGWQIEVLKECPGVLKKLRAASARKAHQLRESNLDFCDCLACTPAPEAPAAKRPANDLAPLRRVRGKSSLQIVAVRR